MLVSLKWLSDYVELPTDIKAMCDKFDLTGTGVEGVERTGDNLAGVVVGHVVACEPHPDSDHMHVTMVDVGADEPLQIVCGAPNMKLGIKTPVATIGTVMPEGFKIKKSKLRGVASCGMCCSKRELGMGADHEGIWILPDDAPIGTPIADYLKLSDTILDLEITPNRPDCLSMAGMAREVGAMYRIPVTYPTRELEVDESLPSVDELATVTVEDAERCPRYTARVIKNVKVGPSPEWLAERVQAAGARSINNIVDVTNYILFLLGQPLHAFDYDKLVDSSGKANVVVRAAADGEKLVTLDEEERELSSDMTVIATPDKAVALAGVMGGLDSEVTDGTTTILLESATFECGRTSRTSRNLGLISESSLRYERGVDDTSCADFSDYAAALMAEVSGGSVCPGIIDVYGKKSEPIELELRVKRCQGMLGAQIPADEMKDILERLGCEVSATADADVLKVVAPTFRPDLEREIDLYEEVLRLYGMDRIPATLPGGRGRLGTRTETQIKMGKINDTLRACGMNETMTYSFADPSDLERLRMPSEGLGIPVELLNPMTTDQSVMRQTIIPGLLRSVAHNQARGVKDIQLYETGTVFFGAEGKPQPREKQKLAGVLAGTMGNATWNRKPDAFDFFDGKGVVENLVRELCIQKVRYKALEAQDAPFLQPGRAAQVLAGGSILGWVGEVHPLAVQAFDAEAPVVAFELDLDALIKASQLSRPYVDVPVYPAVTIDQAFVVSEDVTAERMMQVIGSAGGKLLDSVKLFDVYRDPVRVGAGKKSMAFALEYRAADRTLTAEEVDKQHAKLLTKVAKATGAEIRG